jgi:hypothetical protein
MHTIITAVVAAAGPSSLNTKNCRVVKVIGRLEQELTQYCLNGMLQMGLH